MLRLSVKHKIYLIVFGIGVCLLGGEILLRVSNLFCTQFLLPRYDFPKIRAANTRIIFCLGDSFTYGIGAGFNHSYPAQMEEILNQRSKGLNFKVYNLGVPGYNSTQVANRLRTVVTSCKPDAVVVLCGSNDKWNFRDMKWHWNWGTLAVDSLLSKLRVYRLVTVFFQNMRQSRLKLVKHESFSMLRKNVDKLADAQKLIAYANVYRDAGCYEQAKVFYQKALFLKPQDRLVLMELGRCYKLNREYDRAVETFGGMLKNNVDDSPVYEELDDVFRRLNVIEEPIAFYTALLKKFPGNKRIARQLSSAYVNMAGRLCVNERIAAAGLLYSKAFNIDPENQKAQKMLEALRVSQRARGRDYVLMMQESRYDFLNMLKGIILFDILSDKAVAEDLLNENLTEMITLCKDKGINLIFSGYPHNTSEVTIQVALRDSIPLVEHTRLLEVAPLEAYFVSIDDSHCTRLGYRVMAENIAEAIIDTIGSKYSLNVEH
ncbi:MAG: hypothetical protein KJ893_09725 [Candidatus Omnitrophica bacterium]|nr:hypothetical protein [Candidatus Omnitrophota bacterium]MBU4479260.1 hypothetical protein [Candidatus Omnitrophota bacterium]MCG2703064.1 GDSL-type esterase/lipase family protein [Candidatus Omnitrophota bacterium]